jgi:hypothetical protein
MKIIPTFVALLMSSMMATNPAAADDHHLQIGANETSAKLQLCSAKKACKSIHFSAITPKPRRDDIESIQTQETKTKTNLIENINVLLFGL